MDYNKLLFELLNVQSNPSSLISRVPTNMNEMRDFVTTGKHTILKNFPVQKVYNIGEHVCVGLKETFRLSGAHGGDFRWGYNGSTKIKILKD